MLCKRRMLVGAAPAVRSKHVVAVVVMSRCSFSSSSRNPANGHENPLGLPRSGTPPNLAARMKRGLPEKRALPNVGKVIAVSSAKGGVGKSTVAVNLALAMARKGIATGLLDTDIYGPSVPTLLDLEGVEPELDHNNRILPLTSYGIKAMSMGFLVPPDNTLAWRGMMLQKAINQLLFEIAWPRLDLLVLDLPPGTGDVQLTIIQSIILSGAIVVSTPQQLALRDATRGVDLFNKSGIPILGMIQNMSTFICTNCGHEHDIFGLDGAKRKCSEMGVDFLGDIPLDSQICADADAGKPTVVANPRGPQAEAFENIATKLASKLGLQ